MCMAVYSTNFETWKGSSVSAYGRILRLLIALHSLDALLETGLRICLPEKRQDSTAFDAEQSVLCGPVCVGNIAKYGHVWRISG